MSDQHFDNKQPNQGAQGTFHGPVNFDQRQTHIDQQGQTVHNQTNIAGDVHYHGEPPLQFARPIPPAPPDDFVPRPHEFNQLLAHLLSSDSGPVAITAALAGAGGFGKTTLAKAICHDERVQAAFPEGVLWVEVGQEPGNLIGKVEDLVLHLTGARQRAGFTDLNAAATRLAQALGEQRLLLVIDDVWDSAHLQPFLEGGPHCTRLVTTRLPHVLPAAARAVPVDAMQQDEAVALLSFGLPDAAAHTATLQALAQRLGEWALLLKLVNGALRQRVRVARSPLEKALEYLTTALDRRGLTAFDASTPQQREQAVALTIGVSLDLLTSEEQARYAELAVFPEDVDVPLATVARLWDATGGLDDFASEELCVQLASLSLLLRCDLEQGTIRLHDVVRLYLQQQHADLPALHAALLDAHQPPEPASLPIKPKGWKRFISFLLPKTYIQRSPWANLSPNEPYLWRHLAEHLRDAGRSEELATLLLDFNWLQAKLEATDIVALLADYDALKLLPEAHTLVRKTLWMSGHVLAADTAQIVPQLYGRMCSFDDPAIIALLAQAAASKATPWLRPLHPCFTPPDDPLIRTFAGHSEKVNHVALLPDGQRALSASDDETLKLWNLATGACLRTFEGHRKEHSSGVDEIVEILHTRTRRRRHSAGVFSVAVLPDGQRALSISNDTTLKLWDIQTGSCLRTFEGHRAGVRSVAVLADGQRAFSATGRRLKLWDLATGECLRTFEGHRAVVLPDGQRVFSVGDKLKLWDIATGECLHTFEGHSAEVFSVAVLADGQRALSSSRDATLKLWNLATGECLHTFEGHSDGVNSVTLLPDGQRALSASSRDNTLKLWDLATGECLRTFEGHHAVVLPDGQRALSISNDTTLKLWDIQTGSCLRTFEGHRAGVRSVAVLADGQRALSASNDRTIKLWDITIGEYLPTFDGHSDWVRSVAVLPDGQRALSSSRDATLKLWDLATGACLRTLEGHSDWVRSVTLLPDGQRALSASSRDNTLKLWDLATGECLRTFEGHHAVVLPDGQRALSISNDTTLKLWDIQTGSCLRTFEGHRDWINSVAVLPDGQRALSASNDRTLRLWDITTGVCLRTFGHRVPIKSVALLPDGQRAFSATVSRLRLWDLATGECLRTFEGHRAVVLPDGQRVFSVGDKLKLWDLATGECLHTFEGHRAVVLPDGQRVFSVGDKLKLWDLATGECLHTFEGHSYGVDNVAVLPDGQRALSSSDDTLKLWELETGACLSTFYGEQRFECCAISADGRTVVAGDRAGTVYFLRLEGLK